MQAQYDGSAPVAPYQSPARLPAADRGDQSYYPRAGVESASQSRSAAWSPYRYDRDRESYYPYPENSQVRQAAYQSESQGNLPRAVQGGSGLPYSGNVPGTAPQGNMPPNQGNLPNTLPPGAEAGYPGQPVYDNNDAIAGYAPGARFNEGGESCGWGGEGAGGCGDCCGGSCYPRCSPCDAGCCPLAGRLWVHGDYLLWSTQGAKVPPLVTTSPAGTSQSLAGRLDQPDTTVLFGGNGLNTDLRSGVRVTLGCWLDCDACHFVGLEGNYLTIGRKTAQFEADSGTYPILALPFSNVQTGSQDASLVAFPNVLTGSITVSAATEFQTAEALLRLAIAEQRCYRIEFLMGYRYALLDDDLQISQATTSINPQGPSPVGTTFSQFDRFTTRNQFNGAELGITTHEHWRGWSLDMLMKLSLGSTRSQAVINGTTTITEPQTAPATFPGGILAQPTNIGQYQQDSFCMIPELGLTLGYDLTCNLRATLGYTFIYWSKVARAGDQVDTELNPSQFPPGSLAGAPHPQFAFQTTDFWAQGVNVGLEYRF